MISRQVPASVIHTTLTCFGMVWYQDWDCDFGLSALKFDIHNPLLLPGLFSSLRIRLSLWAMALSKEEVVMQIVRFVGGANEVETFKPQKKDIPHIVCNQMGAVDSLILSGTSMWCEHIPEFGVDGVLLTGMADNGPRWNVTFGLCYYLSCSGVRKLFHCKYPIFIFGILVSVYAQDSLPRLLCRAGLNGWCVQDFATAWWGWFWCWLCSCFWDGDGRTLQRSPFYSYCNVEAIAPLTHARHSADQDIELFDHVILINLPLITRYFVTWYSSPCQDHCLRGQQSSLEIPSLPTKVSLVAAFRNDGQGCQAEWKTWLSLPSCHCGPAR